MLARAFDAFHATLASWKERSLSHMRGCSLGKSCTGAKACAGEVGRRSAGNRISHAYGHTVHGICARREPEGLPGTAYFLRHRTLIGAALGYCLVPRPALLDCVVDQVMVHLRGNLLG